MELSVGSLRVGGECGESFGELRRTNSCAETADVAEELQMIEADGERLEPSHGKAGNCAMVTIGVDAKARLDERNHVANEIATEIFSDGIKSASSLRPRRRLVAKGHDD